MLKEKNIIDKIYEYLLATLVIFALARIFDHGRFIHMNIEISLLLAHLCLIEGHWAIGHTHLII